MCSEYIVINSSARTCAQNVQRSEFIGLDMCSVFMLKEKVVIIGILMFSDLSKKNYNHWHSHVLKSQSKIDWWNSHSITYRLHRSRGTKTKSKVGRGEGVPFIPQVLEQEGRAKQRQVKWLRIQREQELHNN